MGVYEVKRIGERIAGNPYVGRGIVVGRSASGKACAAYFIMGRSANSRNRVLVERDGALFTEPFDPAKVEDPSLIIYAAMRRTENGLVVTNGDQTDTVIEGLKRGISFVEALKTRCFEPDGPIFTPRISAMLTFKPAFSYTMSILKSADETGSACNRFTFEYAPISGVGHFLHTYLTDGSPVPVFQGEPERVAIPDDIDEFTLDLWNNLDENNKIALFVRYVDLSSGAEEIRLVNKNK